MGSVIISSNGLAPVQFRKDASGNAELSAGGTPIRLADPATQPIIIACRSGSLSAPLGTVSPLTSADVLYPLPAPIVIPAAEIEPGDHITVEAWMRKLSGGVAWTSKAVLGHSNSISDKVVISLNVTDVTVNRNVYQFGTVMVASNSVFLKTNYITPGSQTNGAISEETGLDFAGQDTYLNFMSGGIGNVLELLSYRITLYKGR